jgi:predicted ribosome-associated RNA-binding protein Tma20
MQIRITYALDLPESEALTIVPEGAAANVYSPGIIDAESDNFAGAVVLVAGRGEAVLITREMTPRERSERREAESFDDFTA